MSQRSVFRYFATKEQIVLGKFDLVADEMLDALRARPADEPVWTSLRRVLDVIVAHSEIPESQQMVEPIHRLVFDSSDLLAGYLQKMQTLQDGIATELIERAAAAGNPYATDDPTPRTLTAAAFGCLVAAQHTWLASGAKGTFADAVDRALTTIGSPPDHDR